MRSLAFVLLFVPLHIVRRADVPDDRYLTLGAKFPGVVAAGRSGDATLIGDQWLLTAAHVARNLGRAVITIGSAKYTIDRVVLHPSSLDLGRHDIALLHVSRKVSDVKPAGLYRDSNERSSIATIVGHGSSGTGDSRRRVDDGRRRGATSRVDSVTAAWLYFSFDSPPRGTAVEGAPGAGDSGGPAFIMVNGVPMIAGISSAGFDGRHGPGSYGAVDAFTRVSTHVKWIDSVMSSRVADAKSSNGASTKVIPDTPIGRRYAAFLRAVAANTDEAMSRFVRENFSRKEYTSRPALVPNLRRIGAIIKGAAIESISATSDVALGARFRTSNGSLGLELVCDPADHCLLVDWRRY